MHDDDRRISRRALLRFQLARWLHDPEPDPTPPPRAPEHVVEALVELAGIAPDTQVLDVGACGAEPHDLPYPDGLFDVVFCAFGAGLAPRAARELVRVTCPGGVVAVALVGEAGALDGLLEERETRVVAGEAEWLLVRGRRPIPQA